MIYLLIGLCLLSSNIAAQIVHVWDLAEFDQEGQFTIYNPDSNDAEFGTPVVAGDLNGDGLDDLVISAMAGDGPFNGRSNAGEVNIYFSTGVIEGQLDLAPEPSGVVRIYGEGRRDIFGIKTHIDDVTGDGLADLLVGAFYADIDLGDEIRRDAGKLYIFSGTLLTELLATGQELDLGAAWPAGVGVVWGPQARSRLGIWMASGDVNGDGFVDVIVGADQADGFAGPETAPENGRVYVLYGPLDAAANIDLAAPDQALTIIYGVDAIDHVGATVAAGDMNGDGYDDVVLSAAALGTLRNAYDREGGAGDGPDNSRENAGELYVVFGQPDMPEHIDLFGAPPADLLTIYGADGGGSSPDRLGEEVILADVNGDDLEDLLIGAYRADGPDNSRPDAGEVYVVYGAVELPGQTMDMATFPSGTTTIYGARRGAIIGDSIAAGDIHGDGYDDLFIGVPGDEGPLKRRFAGGLAVLAGGPNLPAEIDLLEPQVPVVWIEAPDQYDFAAYWAASGDLDGDGYIDAIPNGMAGDGPNNRRDNAGEAYVVSGQRLAEFLPGVVSTAVVSRQDERPNASQLYPVYPNPFNGTVHIPYQLSVDGAQYALDIFTLGGQRVQRLVSGQSYSGYYEAIWDGRNTTGQTVASGAYIGRLQIGQVHQIIPLTLLK